MPAGFKRADAQLVVVRLYGFASWPKLLKHVGLIGDFTRYDPADVDWDGGVDRFVALACVSYNGDHDPHARTELASHDARLQRSPRNGIHRCDRRERPPRGDG